MVIIKKIKTSISETLVFHINGRIILVFTELMSYFKIGVRGYKNRSKIVSEISFSLTKIYFLSL